jgi:hypothetical protein
MQGNYLLELLVNRLLNLLTVSTAMSSLDINAPSSASGEAAKNIFTLIFGPSNSWRLVRQSRERRIPVLLLYLDDFFTLEGSLQVLLRSSSGFQFVGWLVG